MHLESGERSSHKGRAGRGAVPPQQLGWAPANSQAGSPHSIPQTLHQLFLAREQPQALQHLSEHAHLVPGPESKLPALALQTQDLVPSFLST